MYSSAYGLSPQKGDRFTQHYCLGHHHFTSQQAGKRDALTTSLGVITGEQVTFALNLLQTSGPPLPETP